MQAEHRTLTLTGHLIDCALFRPVSQPAAPWQDARLVLLHEGLGCIAMWRGFPQQLADALDEPVLAYSRLGYGQSELLPAPHAVNYMHREAGQPLLELCGQLDLQAPVLLGHSDGGSIALLHAAAHLQTVAAVIALAPHLFVEADGLASIREAAKDFERTDLRQKLGRYHRDPVRTFEGWRDIWLAEPFAHWNIEAEVAAIRCPILAVQGRQDQYGSLRQIERIKELQPTAELHILEDCRHNPHLEKSAVTLAAIKAFLTRLRASRR